MALRLVPSRFSHQFFYAPDMIGQTGRHCWCRLAGLLAVLSRISCQRRVDATEIVVRDEQAKRRFVVLPFLAMAVCQPGEPPNLHS